MAIPVIFASKTRREMARHKLPVEDWPALLGAETILHRVVAGPLSVDEMRELRQAISRLDLRAQISAVRGADRRPSRIQDLGFGI